MAKKDLEKDLEEESQKNVTIDDFIIDQAITAFSEAYSPSSEAMATEVFNVSRLRDFFQAWPNSFGDPLVSYLDSLVDLGFTLKASASGQLAIFVTNREVSSLTL